MWHNLDVSVSNELDLACNSLPHPNGGCDVSIELTEKVATGKLLGSQQTAFEKRKQMMADQYQSQLSQTKSALLSWEEEIEQLLSSYVAQLDCIEQQ